MDETELKKTCCSCGADLTNRKRHKNHLGEYYCPDCVGNKKGPSQRAFLGLTRSKLRLLAVCASLAAVVCWMLWMLLDVWSHRHILGP